MPRNVIEIKCRLFANNSHFFPLSLFPPSPLFYFRVWHASRSRPISADLLEGSRVKTFGISKGIRMCSYRGKKLCCVGLCIIVILISEIVLVFCIWIYRLSCYLFSWLISEKCICSLLFMYIVMTLIRWIVLREISKKLRSYEREFTS